MSKSTALDGPYGWDLPELTAEQVKWLDEWFSRNRISAAASSPLTCHQGCKYRNSCPLAMMNIPLPIGRECPVERTLLREYAAAMGEAVGIESDDPWSRGLVEYAGLWKILLRRALIEASKGTVVVESYRGVDNEGNALFEQKINPAISLAEKIGKIIHDIGEDLIATKKAKAKLNKERTTEGPEEALRRLRQHVKTVAIEVDARTKRISAPAQKELPPPIEPSDAS